MVQKGTVVPTLGQSRKEITLMEAEQKCNAGRQNKL
jgi:hypothetical protein